MKGIRRSLTVEGLNLERLIRQAGEAGIALSRMKRRGRRMTALAAEDQLPALQEMAQKGGWKLDCGRRHGLGRLLDALHGRRVLAVCGMAALLGLILATQLMWQVEIRDAGVYEADIRLYLDEQGIRPVMWRSGVNTAALRDALEWRYPRVAWFECGWRGMTLAITAVQGMAQGETVTHLGSGDVVAARDGIVSSVVTMAGTPQVKAGDIVREGQVLIQGQERTAQEETRPVMARGKVMARVWDSAAVRLSAVETETVYTGREQEAMTVRSPWFDLWQMPPSGFDRQDVRVAETPLGGIFFPLWVRRETRMKAEVTVRPREEGQLRAEAAVAALRRLREKIGIHDDLVDKWVDYCMIEGEVMEAVATGERLIDIGTPRRGGP